MTYKFKATMTDVYITTITVEATSLREALKLAEEDIEACPIDTRSNTLDSSDTRLEQI